MINIYLNGASGKMGASIDELVAKDDEFNILHESLSNKHDCIIDFSRPESSMELLAECKEKEIFIPVIIGTTGFNDDQIKEINELSILLPILLSFNLSTGIHNLKNGIKKIIDNLDKPTSCKIKEFHHINKIDSPSGTAIELKALIKEVDVKNLISSIHTDSVRKGSFFGIHDIKFTNENIQISIIHKALSRKIFANGALKASKKIIGRIPGIYDLNSIEN